MVPEELSVFAKEKAITLYTHSDPSELLPGDSLRSAQAVSSLLTLIIPGICCIQNFQDKPDIFQHPG